MLKKYKEILKEKGEVYLRIKVRPKAGKSCLKEILDDETLKIDINAAPEKGKANKELMAMLKKEFRLNKEDIKIISGKTDKLKLIKICQTKKK